MKRAFDIVCALAVMLITAPLLGLIAILIKLDSPGPVIFKQIRKGKGLRDFYIHKFRTMVQDAPEKGGPLTVGNDPRITRMGRTLRTYKLDELPQLINIIKGEMSVVGPRPEVPRYIDRDPEKFKTILTIRPGLTDLASLEYLDEAAELDQVPNAEEHYIQKVLPQKLALAKTYIQNQSFLLDLAIIFQTLINLCGFNINVLHLPDLPNPGIRKPPRVWTNIRYWFLKFRRPAIVILDVGLIAFTNYLAFWLRFDGNIPIKEYTLYFQMLPWLILLRAMAFNIFRLNEGLWRYTSLWDVQKIVGGVLLSTLAFYALVHWDFAHTWYPRSIYIIDSLLLIVALVAIRLPWRLLRELSIWKQHRKVLIIGTGDASARLIQEIKTHPSYHYYPIGLISDGKNPLNGQQIHGVRVLGTQKDLPRILLKVKPDEVIIALTESRPGFVREIVKAFDKYNVPIKTLPSMKDLLDGRVSMNALRNLAIEDLLPRGPVDLDPHALQDFISDSRVMVTGAGGSIGGELCRQIAALKPKALILYERHENSLYSLSSELTDHGYQSFTTPVIGDITDSSRLYATMEQFRPTVIFHAAAHKHVPMMEMHPGEAIKNNTMGTRILTSAADFFGVKRFVFISSDKAVNPSSIMGATKRAAELVVQELVGRSRTQFLIVRFGNVLGSNGSVVPRFLQQIRQGGPITVTHPDMQRYFMLIPEAVNLILQTAARGERGGIYILEMGEQLKLVDLARNLIRLSGYLPDKEIPITFTGLRPGEKLSEELVGPGEMIESSVISKVFRINSHSSPPSEVIAKKIEELQTMQILNNDDEAIKWLKDLVTNYEIPNTNIPPVLPNPST